jgi:hypothetical protein
MRKSKSGRSGYLFVSVPLLSRRRFSMWKCRRGNETRYLRLYLTQREGQLCQNPRTHIQQLISPKRGT